MTVSGRMLFTDTRRFPVPDAAKSLLGDAGIAFEECAAGDVDAIVKAGQQAEAILVFDPPITDPVIAQLPRCRVLARCGTGTDNIDLAAADRRGIIVTYVPAFSTDEVADHAIALLLACARKLVYSANRVRAGHWDTLVDLMPMERLSGRTLGILGFGRIGRAVAQRAKAFGLRVIACDPYAPADSMREAGVTPVGIDELLRRSDYLTLHVPHTPETHHLIGRRALALMKPGGVLINTARGKLIDQGALTEALRTGRLRAAGLDVLEVEPPPSAELLVRMDNVVVTPHSAAFSREAIEEVYQTAVEDSLRVLQGAPPMHPAPGTRAWQRRAAGHEE